MYLTTELDWMGLFCLSLPACVRLFAVGLGWLGIEGAAEQGRLFSFNCADILSAVLKYLLFSLIISVILSSLVWHHYTEGQHKDEEDGKEMEKREVGCTQVSSALYRTSRDLLFLI